MRAEWHVYPHVVTFPPQPVLQVPAHSIQHLELESLDADALLKLVSADLPREELSPPAPPSQEIPFPSAAPRRWSAYAFALGALVVALAAYEFFPSGSEPAKARSAAA